MKVLGRMLPAPLASAAVLGLWLALARDTSAAQILVGLLLAVITPHLGSKLRVAPARARRPLVFVRFLLRVGRDVLVSNAEVALGVVGARRRPPQPRFVTVPLDLRDPVGLAALAMVTTVVPGTVWSELALDRGALLLHAWDVDDEPSFVARFKARYEAPLREIFE